MSVLKSASTRRLVVGKTPYKIETPRRRAAGNPRLTVGQAIPSRTFLLRCSLTPWQSRRGMRSPEFKKVFLEPGESKTIDFVIFHEEDLSFTGADYL